jgi:hypothetical protein
MALTGRDRTPKRSKRRIKDETNPKDLIGVTKAPLRLVPPILEILTSVPMAVGAKKYGAFNWRKSAVRHSLYLEAARRHIDAILDGEVCDEETKIEHEASVAACMAIIMDARSIGKLVDDLCPVRGGATKELKRVATVVKVLGLSYMDADPRTSGPGLRG